MQPQIVDLQMPRQTFKTSEQTTKTCDGRCFAERRVHCRELGKWGKPMLMTIVGGFNFLISSKLIEASKFLHASLRFFSFFHLFTILKFFYWDV